MAVGVLVWEGVAAGFDWSYNWRGAVAWPWIGLQIFRKVFAVGHCPLRRQGLVGRKVLCMDSSALVETLLQRLLGCMGGILAFQPILPLSFLLAAGAMIFCGR